MPTAILNGPVNQQGVGKQVCSFTGGTLRHPTMKLGPDGANWVLLSDAEVITLTTQHIRYQHVSVAPIKHLCAQKSRWAFTVFDSSLPHGVAFLHIRPPRALADAMGDDPNMNVFTGADILRCYLSASEASRSPRVWRRDVPGWDEIAVNFCVNHV